VLRFNAAEAFIGTVLIDIEDPPTQNEDAAPEDEVDDRRTLVYKTFLAAPYVPHGFEACLGIGFISFMY